MANATHEHTTDCGLCEQNERIRENMKADLETALETGNLELFESIFEDRDPFEFI